MVDPALWLQEHANWPVVYDFFSDIGGPVGWWVLLQFFVLLAGTQRGLRLAWFVGVAALLTKLKASLTLCTERFFSSAKGALVWFCS